jgi:hypothetical protein
MRLTTFLGSLVVVLGVVAACGSSGAPNRSAPPTPGPSPIVTAADTAAAVVAHQPLFTGIEERDPDRIGQGSSWTAVPADTQDPPGSWTVTYVIGWGDCPAGCIDSHTWTYAVTGDGEVRYVSEAGSPLTDEAIAERAAGITESEVVGRVTAGPTCPVERPGDPACVPRPVDGATLHITAADGSEIRSLSPDAGGWFATPLDPGDYVLTAEPVEGLMGTPGPIAFTVTDRAATVVDVRYDTGIR